MTEMVLPGEVTDFIGSEAGAMLRGDVLAWTGWQREQLWYREAWLGDVAPTASNLAFHANKLFVVFPEFRTLYDHRMALGAPRFRGIVPQLARRSELHLSCNDMGPGFLIEHGHSTIVLAASIGADFKVGQNVTIGANGGVPVIGDRVTVRTGAVVVGPIRIEDDCVITVNATVTRSMPRGYAAYAPRSIYKPRSRFE